MSLAEFEKYLYTIIDVMEKWSMEDPDKVAIIMANTSTKCIYQEFKKKIDIYAFKLFKMGFRKGDIITTNFVFNDSYCINFLSLSVNP